MVLSPALKRIKPSITLAITSKAKAMQAKGIDVIALSAGEPDFGTPRHICDAAVTAIKEGFTRYTPASGINELKEVVCEKFKRDNGLDYTSKQVIINCGAKHSVFLAVLALVGPEDEVIIPSPYWVSYPEMVKLAGGKPVIVSCSEENGMKISAEQLRKAITPKTKMFILNSPSNPTGMVYTEDEIEALGKVIVETGIYVIADEIYEKLIYDGIKHVSIASLSNELLNRTITVNGVSKAYCMTGWRIGYAAGPEEIIKGMGIFQSQETSNPCSISQKAALAALNGSHDFLGPMLVEFDRRRQYIVERLNSIEGISCNKPMGSFYVFPKVSSFYGKNLRGTEIDGSLAFCEYMLNEKHIAIVPGIGFGADEYVRISYATSMDNIEKALDRFENGLKELE
ncbi:MAG: pyridoxal phosphate-dependent aminotransferase [Candidatus Latescibacteria bacterium]|nr:pyridoxal phosphate-dependent aminotransferase [Candidatus Latescibacterota bacterium]